MYDIHKISDKKLKEDLTWLYADLPKLEGIMLHVTYNMIIALEQELAIRERLCRKI